MYRVKLIALITKMGSNHLNSHTYSQTYPTRPSDTQDLSLDQGGFQEGIIQSGKNLVSFHKTHLMEGCISNCHV